MFIFWHPTVRQTPPFPSPPLPVFLPPFLPSKRIHAFLFHSMDSNPFLPLIILMLEIICPRPGQWEPHQVGSYRLLKYPSCSLHTSLCSSAIRYSQLILSCSCSSLGISHFSKELRYVSY